MSRNSWMPFIVALAGIVPLAACSSDRSGLSTAPSGSSPSTEVATATVTGARFTAQEETGNTITSLVTGTSCPNLQLKISAYTIKTDADTTYSGGTCASLKAGTVVSLTLRATTEKLAPKAIQARITDFQFDTMRV